MKNILLFFLIFSSHVFAQGFEKIASENTDYRDFSREELSARIGENAALLPYYACNGVNEFDPFYAPARSNPNGDSLKILGYKTDEVITYKDGHFYDSEGAEIAELKNIYFKYVARAFKRFEKHESSKKLLRFLEHSYFPLTIRFGGNSFVPTLKGGIDNEGIYRANAITYFSRGRMADDRLPFNDVGVGGFISWHPQDKIQTIEQDNIRRETDLDIALAHEMFHAFDSIRGLLDMRHIWGEGYEIQMGSEYRAVYFENLVRKEFGVFYRKYYGHADPLKEDLTNFDFSSPGVLDINGEPHMIPAPCL